ncbi:hypothetical protein [Caenimonas aquaedulcis]|uniref:Uncharacterized protein n=1 Tax=Caenimonas aquaedulcis TaxID=2793270 RepID=A0A931H6G4_9BURK|nr:hypothetical protein [Caenimonas aquaedulcis]MBG9389337.1 hypothetical protein [Caenimonas aquaedulcis]
MSEDKKGFDLNQFAKPIAKMETGQGKVYLYQADENVRKLHRELVAQPAEARALKTFRRITSQEVRQGLSDQVVPLPDAVFGGLAESEIAQLAELFRINRYKRRVKSDKPLATFEPKRSDESALAFFDRILDADIQEGDAEAREQHKKLLDMLQTPANKILEQLNASSDRLGGTLSKYESLATLEIPPMRDFAGEQFSQMAKERREDRVVARLTADMTKQSAEMLRDLVEAAGTFLVRFDQRDAKSDRQINIQLWVAVVSLILSVVLSGVGAWYARAAYYQDEAKNKADDTAAKATAERDTRIDTILQQNAKIIEELQKQKASSAPVRATR